MHGGPPSGSNDRSFLYKRGPYGSPDSPRGPLPAEDSELWSAYTLSRKLIVAYTVAKRLPAKDFA